MEWGILLDVKLYRWSGITRRQIRLVLLQETGWQWLIGHGKPWALSQRFQKDYSQQNESQNQRVSAGKVVSTDPPYYDNIGYADLSDFFYIWLRRALKPIFPSLFATLAVPKAEELVAPPYRHGSKDVAEAFFLDGMTQAMQRLASQAHPCLPITVYYAFKQSETKAEAGAISTGWETFLDAVIRSGLSLTGTWPMKTEGAGRIIARDSNALASSIILVCRPRPVEAKTISRRAFLRELNQVLPAALDGMTRGAGDARSPVAPVDLSQAIIGPGMAVFSKYAAVLEADGTPMSVRLRRFSSSTAFWPRTTSTTTLSSVCTGFSSMAGVRASSARQTPLPVPRARVLTG